MGSINRTIDHKELIAPSLLWVRDMITQGLKAGPVVLTLGRPKRTIDQNSKLWPMLTDIANQATWFNRKLDKEQWKDLLTANWKEQDCVPGVNGGVVFFGHRTSKLNIGEFSELIESIYAFGSEYGVQWSETANNTYREIILRKINAESRGGGIPDNGRCGCGNDIVKQAMDSNDYYITGCRQCHRSFV